MRAYRLVLHGPTGTALAEWTISVGRKAGDPPVDYEYPLHYSDIGRTLTNAIKAGERGEHSEAIPRHLEGLVIRREPLGAYICVHHRQLTLCVECSTEAMKRQISERNSAAEEAPDHQSRR